MTSDDRAKIIEQVVRQMTADGGAVFPFELKPDTMVSSGMTLREHYAGLALSGLVASGVCTEGDSEGLAIMEPADIATLAWDVADAMVVEKIKRMDKGGTNGH